MPYVKKEYIKSQSRPAGTATLVCNLDSKCRILRKHSTEMKLFNKPGASASNPLFIRHETSRIFETGRVCVENRYGPLESLCEEGGKFDCSNARHDALSQVGLGRVFCTRDTRVSESQLPAGTHYHSILGMYTLRKYTFE